MFEIIFYVVATFALYISMKLVLKSVGFAFKSFTGQTR